VAPRRCKIKTGTAGREDNREERHRTFHIEKRNLGDWEEFLITRSWL
jgi:hypothetical protein